MTEVRVLTRVVQATILVFLGLVVVLRLARWRLRD
jgi:hypothetical protein